jgi:DNA-binding transcriptional ArsR family regulator
MKSNDAIESLAALAQETRLAIYRLLVQAGPEGLAAGAIAEKLGVAPATLSFHLKELARAGLVTSRTASRFVYYAASFERMAALMTYLTENCCRGMPGECLAPMETALSRCSPAAAKGDCP